MNATLKDELIQRGYTENSIVLDRGYKQYLTKDGKVVLTKGGYYDYPFISQTAKKVSKDKNLSYDFANIQGVHIPATLQTTDIAQANEFLATYKKVVVKPAELGGGKGLTVDITDETTLKLAIEKATFGNKTPLIQQQFIGEEMRLTVLAGKVHSAILRRTPRVTGDGISTIQQLIERENSDRLSLKFPLLTYPQLDATMMPVELFNGQAVIDNGQTIELSRATMIGRGASFYGILQQIHPSYLAIAEKLANNLNPSMLVIDLMVKNFTEPASDDNYIFLEFNTAPALQIYSSIRAGDQPDVISKLADMVEAFAEACA